MNKTLIFCVSRNCSKITAVMLKSFHKHHDRQIHVVGTLDDFEELEKSGGHHPNNYYVNISNNQELLDDFKQGHRGTTKVFAMVISGLIGEGQQQFIHIDGDVFFKKESISIIEKAFEEGYDLVGTRRCYGNNPSGIKGLEPFPDTISTYIFGMKTSKLPKYPFDQLCRYCEGAAHPLGWMVLDAFDGITHAVMNNGGTVFFLDQNEFGSQDIHGKKTNNYELNMHMDVGSHVIHFGGTGSGYSYYNNRSKPQEGYAKWAVGRWALFAKVFYDETVECNEPTVYGSDGRWINGSYDDKILQLTLNEIQ